MTLASNSSSTAPQAETAPARVPPGFSSQVAMVSEARIHYVRGGGGPPLLLLHGFPQDWSEWRAQLPSLAEHFTVLAVDLPGTGMSDAAPSGHDTAAIAARVRGLMVALGFDTGGLSIAGHDIGLWVAYAYAAQWPDEVTRMVVIEAPIPDESIFSHPALMPAGPSPWHVGFFQESMAEHLISGREVKFVRDFIGQFLYRQEALADDDYRYYGELLAHSDRLAGWLSHYRAVRRDVQQNGAFRAQGRLPMPILAVGGQYSLGPHVAAQWRQYADEVHEAVIEESGHWVPEEQPAQTTEALLRFLAVQSAAR